MIDAYTESSEKWAKRNDLHVRMVEQAGEDRVLFLNAKPHDHVDMKFPEYVSYEVIMQRTQRGFFCMKKSASAV